ncbi:MAG: RNA polymerase sigma factor [Marmoricola sp.]
MTVHDRADVRAALRDSSRDLLAYFERRLDCHEDAADLLGETMLQVWRRAESCPVEPERQRMWLFTIATNVLANERRSRRRRSALSDRLRGLLTGDAETEADLAEAQAVRDAVMRLPFTHRELITLIHWEQFNAQEAAEILGINASTARSRYGAARALLREALFHDDHGKPTCARRSGPAGDLA